MTTPTTTPATLTLTKEQARALGAIHACAAGRDRDCSPAMSGLRLARRDPGGEVIAAATDGKILAETRIRAEELPDRSDAFEVILPPALVEWLGKAKGTVVLSGLGGGLITAMHDDGMKTANPIPAMFPRYDGVFEPATGAESGPLPMPHGIDAKYLARLGILGPCVMSRGRRDSLVFSPLSSPYALSAAYLARRKVLVGTRVLIMSISLPK